MSRSSVLASLASQDVSASEFDKLDADNGSDYQSQVDLKSPLASPTFTGSITTPEIRSGATLTIDPATVGDNTGLVLLKGNLQVDGLMTIGPLTDNQNKRKKAFQSLKDFFSMINETLSPEKQAKELSMGMSDDFLLAIKEGSTMIRIGTNIFGSRKTNA